MCILFVYTLLKAVGYYECSAHVSDGFPKKVWMVGGWGQLNSIFLGFLESF